MRRPAQPIPAETTVTSDPALAETRLDDALPATTTIRDHSVDLSALGTFDTFADSAGAREGDVRASVSPPGSEEGLSRYAEGPLLGMGGMGEVRLHIDERIGRPVALKTLRSDIGSVHAMARFLREARVQGQLEHPGIVPVYDLATNERGRPYFTMKRVRGQTLGHILSRLRAGDADARARFSRHKLISAFVQVCLALEYAHERGVIHRDLKPGNVMLGSLGEVYVLDWGIAKATGDVIPDDEDAPPRSAIPGMTRAGDLIGTPLYMSPEQLRAEHDSLDVRSDVFALGAILFEILTLSHYRRPGTVEEMVKQGEQVRLPSSLSPDVPPELDAICARALAPDAAERFASALALAEALEGYLEGDRDQAARKALADKHLEAARARLAAGGGADAEVRVGAMREALKALALSPDDVEVQRLLLSLVVDGSGTLPEPGEREFAEGDVEIRRQGTRFGIWGYFSWLASLPLAIWAGVRDWTIPALLTGLTLTCIVVASVLLRRGMRHTYHGVFLAVLSAAVVVLSSGWLGPFVLVPIAACATSVMFVLHSNRAERPWLLGVWASAALLPFAGEALGVFPPAFTFRGGELVLHPRIIELPPGPTLIAMAYTSVSFLVLLCVFVGRLRDRQRAAERRLFVQAWHLRQLFPAGADAASTTGG
jgi:serine/threonine-protein kinase